MHDKGLNGTKSVLFERAHQNDLLSHISLYEAYLLPLLCLGASKFINLKYFGVLVFQGAVTTYRTALTDLQRRTKFSIGRLRPHAFLDRFSFGVCAPC